MKDLVIFDIDNTIIKGQSQALLLKFLFSRNYIPLVYYVRLMMWFMVYKLGFVDNPLKIMKRAFEFLKGKNRKDVEEIIEIFFQTVLRNKFYPEALEIIRMHQKEGREVILVSNAVDVLVERIAKFLNLSKYLCTRLEVVNGVYTGNIDGGIMYSENKLEAVKKYISSYDFSLDRSWGYGDHESDSHLLLNVKYPYAVNPSSGLAKIASVNNWEILHFKL
jgi:HAD superfamily hydrolase (TIGR01490 family)